jgi:hypothetical protein
MMVIFFTVVEGKVICKIFIEGKISRVIIIPQRNFFKDRKLILRTSNVVT